MKPEYKRYTGSVRSKIMLSPLRDIAWYLYDDERIIASGKAKTHELARALCDDAYLYFTQQSSRGI